MDEDEVSSRVWGAVLVMVICAAVLGLHIYITHGSKIATFSAKEIEALKFVKWRRDKEQAREGSRQNDGNH